MRIFEQVRRALGRASDAEEGHSPLDSAACAAHSACSQPVTRRRSLTSTAQSGSPLTASVNNKPAGLWRSNIAWQASDACFLPAYAPGSFLAWLACCRVPADPRCSAQVLGLGAAGRTADDGVAAGRGTTAISEPPDRQQGEHHDLTPQPGDTGAESEEPAAVGTRARTPRLARLLAPRCLRLCVCLRLVLVFCPCVPLRPWAHWWQLAVSCPELLGLFDQLRSRS